MNPREKIKLKLVKQWLEKAEADLESAKILFSSQKPLYSIIGFHSQQSAEKYLKAYLTFHQIEFPKTHNLKEILDLVAIKNPKLADSLRESQILSSYAISARYPGDFPKLTRRQAQKAINLAEKVKNKILKEIELKK